MLYAPSTPTLTGEQPRLRERSLDQIGELEDRGPMAQVREIESFPLDLEHAENIAPLPIRDAASLPVPAELAKDQVFRARNEERRPDSSSAGERRRRSSCARSNGASSST